MRVSERYSVPGEAALLYDFANSLDVRRFVERGAPHQSRDELETVSDLNAWLRAHGIDQGRRVDAKAHRTALALREALRGFIAALPDERGQAAPRLMAASGDFPLILEVSSSGVELKPSRGAPAGGLGRVLAELHQLSATGKLDRVKMCASDECHWVFYDRSKPGNRRWCSSALCGNRQKTRAYRHRQHEASAEPAAE